ncbi:ATP-dependent helicase BRM isoform X2 [Physcomitrium patens]|uniref:ATP-dependent helicase BRM isoform X2 n=1 Tax=Physcomitrium patens TaxID=3218 RepID=UPI000D163316|nr:ATP-dependent helicase BRM-like isoform X2 [Physcomitrium patens]|eukprot:XP_024372220.1 ATP-dependent helicase BRM-like isoform X2 [Physcomitrella patens]
MQAHDGEVPACSRPPAIAPDLPPSSAENPTLTPSQTPGVVGGAGVAATVTASSQQQPQLQGAQSVNQSSSQQQQQQQQPQPHQPGVPTQGAFQQGHQQSNQQQQNLGVSNSGGATSSAAWTQLAPAYLLQQLQHLRDSGQASDPRYKTILSFLQAQQAAGNNQGVASIGGSTGGGPSGSLPSSIQQRFQQDGNSRSSGDSQTTSLGNSDSSRGSQSHSQAAYLQQALLSAQQKAQATAYSQQKVTKPLQTGPTRDFNSANNLNMQELMHRQLAGRQLQQLPQPGSVAGGQTNSAEKPRNQARPGNQQPSRSDAMSVAYPHGSFPRPTSGVVQGVQNHQQRVQSNSSSQFSGMTTVSSAMPANTLLPVQAQSSTQFLPQYQAHVAAMQNLAGQSGMMMSQTRPMAVSGPQLTSGVDQSRIGAVGGAPMLMTSSGLPLGGYPKSVPMPMFYQGIHGSNSSVSGGTAPEMIPSFVMYHNSAQGGEARTQSSATLQSNTEGFGVSQQSRHPPAQQQPSGFGFSKYQLTLLRNQILAFKKLRARKPGETTVAEEIKRLINPPLRSSQHSSQLSAVSRLREQAPIPQAVGKEPEPLGKVAHESNSKPVENRTKESSVTKDSEVSKEVNTRDGAIKVDGTPSATCMPNVDSGNGKGAPSMKLESPQVKSEQRIKHEGAAKTETKDMKSNKVDISRMSGPTSTPNVTGSRTPPPSTLMPPSIRKVLPVKMTPYRGPLFDFPPVSKRIDGAALSLPPQAIPWGQPVSLGYKVEDLLLDEGVRVIDKKRAERLETISDVLNTRNGKKLLQSYQIVRLRIEEKKLRLLELQHRVRDEVEQQQQEIMAMGERAYRKFVRLCDRQRMDLSRQSITLQKTTREKHLKALMQWRKKLLESQWASRDARVTRNRGVAKYHERMLREYSKRKDEDRTKRMEALKNNDVDAYREMLKQQQGQLNGDAGERFEVLSSFLSQTEEYLHKLGGKISAVKNHQEREEAATAAAASARAQGYSEEEAQQAAIRASEEAEVNGYVNRVPHDSSVHKYYSLAHAVHEKIVKQPSMLAVGVLRDYQMVGLQWMLSLYNNRLNGILADEMGLGKTVQVMALIAYLMEFKGNYGPHLIIVPNAVMVNWKSELTRWLPSASCIYYVGHKDQRAKIFSQEVCSMKFNVLVTTYEFIMRDRSKLAKVDWKYIIIDEAQRMKDRESRLARDLDRFRCSRRLLLTGTPLQNDLHELWSLLNLLLPEVFDNSKAFHEWFSKPFQKDPTQSEEDDWLETEKKVIVIHRLHQILEPFMLRRRVEDVEGSLPPKVSVVLKCKMSAYQAAIYDWVKTTGTLRLDPDDEAQRIAGNSKRQARAYAPLQNKCMELRKVCNHPYLNYPPRYHIQGDMTVRTCGKLWILDRILVKLHKTGHRVLLFSTMTRLLDILEDYLQWRRLIYRRIDGMTTLEARESAIVEFNRPDSDCFIFLLSIRAAGRGLNLQTADTVIVYDPDPNPKNEEQAVARAHRIGQKREVRVIYMEAVVESTPSYEKEDELRSGGSLDEKDDEMAGKDRYVGSVESLVRNNIQQHKIDMADEVINAGRFDQRTTQEERRLTLEALLHDEERYQQTVHDVPTLQEVNRMIARTDDELELFDKMDEEWKWVGDLLPHHKIPKWMRVGSREVNAAIEATSKESMKKGFLGAVGTQEAEDLLAHQVIKGPAAPPKALEKRSKSTSRYKNYREVEIDDDFFPEKEAEEYEEDERESVIEEVLTAANADDEEEEEGGVNEGEDQDEDMRDVEGEEHEVEEIIEEVIEEVDDDDEEEEEEAEPEEDVEEEGELAPEISSDEGEMSPVKPQRVAGTSQSKKFASLSALESRSSKAEEGDELEEGEIAASVDSDQRSESWIEGREEAEDVADYEVDHTIQPQKKRKRSRSHRRTVHLDGLGERETSNGSFNERETPLLSFRSNNRAKQNPPEWSNFGTVDPAPQSYDKTDHWGGSAKKRSVPFPEAQVPARPRIVFKHSRANGLHEPAAEPDLGRDNRTARTQAGLLGSYCGDKGRLPEGQQKKCKSVLSKLHGAVNKDGRQIAALFLELPKRSELPEYYKVIARPINAHLIEEKLDRLEYPSVLEFASDVHLMIDNAARYYSTSAEVQTDARRLQALFDSRMSLIFPEVDFSSARVRSNAPVLTPQAPPVTGSRGILQAPVVTGPRGVRRPAGAESAQIGISPNSRSSTRISLVRPVAPPQEEVLVTNQEGKKSKKGGNEKLKDKNAKSKSKVNSSGKKKELQEEEAESDQGIMHPVDLVIHKKKRKGREHTGSRTVSSPLVFDVEEMREASARGFTVGSSGNARAPPLATPRPRAPAASPASSRLSASQPDIQVGAVTVLKKSRTDGGKRRPSHP